MTALPVVVSYGGINPAGRSSFDQAYRRMVIESLDGKTRRQTLLGLAATMNLIRWDGSRYVSQSGQVIAPDQVESLLLEPVSQGTLVRRIEPGVYNADAAPWHKPLTLNPAKNDSLCFTTRARNLPAPLPASWQVKTLGEDRVEVHIQGSQECYIPTVKDMPVKAAGQLPSGFDPAILYNSRFQPRGLQMAIYGASDAIYSLGIDWQRICAAVAPDQIGTYASSILGQMQDEGWGGCLKSRWLGQRNSSKQVPMGFASMPADFINAYVLGSVGHTESIMGACASFLYNLQAAIRDITAGRRRVALVGGSEAPITLEVMEGFYAMSALASDSALAKLDGLPTADPRRYSRPFGDNVGFAMGESSQYVVLMDDALAVELGAEIHGAVTGVFMNADGIKKSISSTGPGNYVTLAKSLAVARSILGEKAVRERSLLMAHGSGTPQNRVTESLIFDRVAEAFGIERWPLCAVKAYLGHSMGVASGDQFAAAIGTMRHGWLPGIKTINRVADDVHQKRLHIPLQDIQLGRDALDMAIINAKGFGGNNASGVLFSPAVTETLLAKRHNNQWKDYCKRRETTREAIAEYGALADRGLMKPIYRFGEGMIDEQKLWLDKHSLQLPGLSQPISLDFENPYSDML